MRGAQQRADDSLIIMKVDYYYLRPLWAGGWVPDWPRMERRSGRDICAIITKNWHSQILCCFSYYAICEPLLAKYKCTVGRTRKIIVCLWILSFLLALPVLYAQVIFKSTKFGSDTRHSSYINVFYTRATHPYIFLHTNLRCALLTSINFSSIWQYLHHSSIETHTDLINS